MCAVAVLAGAKLTEHCAVPVAGSEHVPPDPSVPPLSLEKDSDPDGRDMVPASVSETVAVQVAWVPIDAELGEQDTEVADVRCCPPTPVDALLVLCAASPP